MFPKLALLASESHELDMSSELVLSESEFSSGKSGGISSEPESASFETSNSTGPIVLRFGRLISGHGLTSNLTHVKFMGF